MIYHNYVAVIGRIPYDDEDTVHLFENCTWEEARIRFAYAMYCGDTEAQEANIREIGGDLGVFINHVLVSDSPITAV